MTLNIVEIWTNAVDYLVIWCPIRRQTIELLNNQKEEILKIVRDVRIAKIAGSATSLIAGGALTITGLALIPFTLGASIGLMLAGAGVGALGTATSIGAAVVSKVMKSTRLKEAHEHIKLDQQLSSNVNDIANEYNRALQSQEKAKMKKTDMAHCTLGIGSHASVGVFKSRPTAFEKGLTSGRDIARIGTMGLKTGGFKSVALAAVKIGGRVIARVGLKAAGGVVGGVALAVTAPLNIYQIASNSYHLVKSSRDVENEKDSTCNWYMNKIKEMKRELDRIENIIAHMELEEDYKTREMPHCQKIWFLNSAARTTAIVVAILTILIFFVIMVNALLK